MQHKRGLQFRVYYHMVLLFKADFKNKKMYNLRTVTLIKRYMT